MEIVKISISSEYFAKAMGIYQISFPESERHSLEIITKRINIGKEVLFGLINDSHELLGIIMLWDLEYMRFKVLDYFAIDERYRSMHYGEMFLAETIKLSISNGEVLVLEIETPYNKSQDTLEYKRLKFYRKFNVYEYPAYYYRMPNLSGDGFLDMSLLTIGNEKQLTNNELDELALEIYKQMYYLDEQDARKMISENCHLSQLL